MDTKSESISKVDKQLTEAKQYIWEDYKVCIFM